MRPVSGLKLSCMLSTEPLLVAVVSAPHSGPAGGTETQFLALQVAGGLNRQSRERPPWGRFRNGRRVPPWSDQQHAMTAKTIAAWRIRPVMRPNIQTRCHGDQDDAHALDDIGEEGRVFEWMRRVGTEEPAAVGAQLFNGDESRDRSPGDDLHRTFKRFGRGRALQGHGNPAQQKQHRHHHRQGQQDEKGRPHEIAIEVSEQCFAGQPPGQGGQGGDSRWRRKRIAATSNRKSAKNSLTRPRPNSVEDWCST